MVQLKRTMVYHSLPWYKLFVLWYKLFVSWYKLFVPWYSYTVPWYTTVYRGIPWLHHGCAMVLFHKGQVNIFKTMTVMESLFYNLLIQLLWIVMDCY